MTEQTQDATAGSHALSAPSEGLGLTEPKRTQKDCAMPDFERLTDSLRVFAAPDAAAKEWARGYQAGKTAARLQIAAIAAVLVLLWLGGAGLNDAWR